MLTGLPLYPEWQAGIVRSMFGMARWNLYVRDWPVVLEALHELWENEKVSELKTPFYELIEKPASK